MYKEQPVFKTVNLWLIAGVLMIVLQIVIGGITRLTGSGLSITKWEIVIGAIPPANDSAWAQAFELYKQTPQYHKINQGMSIEDFKFIYFWEYFHRLWARLMFVVFIIPFTYFVLKKMLPKWLIYRLGIVVALAGFEGFLGWIMVKSGLRERPWVNAYNLTLHLTMGLIIFSYLLWTVFKYIGQNRPAELSGIRQMSRFSWAIIIVCFFQLMLGAMMSGSKAGLFFPAWPDMGDGTYIPAVIFDTTYWHADSFTHYDTNPFMPALIQFLHRNTAYILTLLVCIFAYGVFQKQPSRLLKGSIIAGLLMLLIQVLLGIFTLINCKGEIPVTLGVLHQAGAVVLLSVLLWQCFLVSQKK